MRTYSVLLLRSTDLGWADLRAALDEMPDARLVGEASTAQRGLDLAATLRPDVIVSAATLDREPIEPLLVSLRRSSCLATKIVVPARVDPSRLGVGAACGEPLASLYVYRLRDCPR
jgi:hypothetical protein